MFSLAYGFFEYMTNKPEANLLIVGLDGAGKTTYLEQLKGIFAKKNNKRHHIPLDKIFPTVGMNLGKLEITGYKVTLWDLGGQVGLRPIWDSYVEDAHGLMFVIDATNKDRFQEAKEALESLLKSPELLHVPLLLLANKTELHNSCKHLFIASFFEDVLADTSRPVKLMECSAVTKEGIEGALHWLVDASIKGPKMDL